MDPGHSLTLRDLSKLCALRTLSSFVLRARTPALHQFAFRLCLFATLLLNLPRMPDVPKTMRAVVYRGVNDLRVETLPVPRLTAPAEWTSRTRWLVQCLGPQP